MRAEIDFSIEFHYTIIFEKEMSKTTESRWPKLLSITTGSVLLFELKDSALRVMCLLLRAARRNAEKWCSGTPERVLNHQFSIFIEILGPP